MSKPDFVHLHVHSDYSVLDGACKIEELLERCNKFGMNACALTDHGNIFGAIEFYQAAKKKGVKPILGCELYVSPTTRFDRSARSSGQGNHHFLVLCENAEGYHNLCKLSTLGYLEGFHYKPRVDDDLLAKHSAGLIATSSCLGGRIPQLILANKLDEANEAIRKYVHIFGKDNFLIELMDHGLDEQNQVNPILAQMAVDHGLLLIATNDCHYIDKDDAEAHDALLCVQTGTTLQDENRFRFPNNQFYFRTPDEMREKFSQWPESVTNTQIIADRCDVQIELGQRLIPEYIVPEGYTKFDYLRELVMSGLQTRYGTPPPPDFVARAEFELDVINTMQFVDYFLVVWDLIAFAKSNGIPVGPGRGSGAGSIVAYALKITNIEPMRYNLLFERFLNPERVSMPDFDIDFCFNRREEVIKYSQEKYGSDNVSQIITFGRMLARQVVRNVGRVLGMPYGDVDRIAKLIPEELKITLKDAVAKEPEIKRLLEEDQQVAKLWRLAERLEGTIGNCGTHAAGVVICDHPLTDHVALYKAAGSDVVATQVDMKYVEEVGLLKMDFLGLRTLTVIHEAVRLIKEGRGVHIDIDEIETTDDNAYQLLRSGQTTGIFQLESSGMRDLAKRIGLQSMEEMSALVALFRPGPMQFIDLYIQNKFNPAGITYEHPLLEPILKETYGIPVYQEQVMQITQALAGFSLGQADIMRRAMGKKKAELMAEQRSKFVEGCKSANNIEEALANTVFDKIELFAGYGFNKSHSVGYAFVAYQTAYLKANYTVEFMCALLTSESGNLDKIALYVEECRRMNVEVSPPCVNRSIGGFSVEGNTIRFGLGAIKNVGEGPVRAIVAERAANGPFKDIYDMCSRLDGRVVNRRLLESLNKAGALLSMGWSRAQVEKVLDDALSVGQSAARDRASGQTSLFDMEEMIESGSNTPVKPDIPEWPEHELLQLEKEMLGLYISSHPLARHADKLRRFSTLRLLDVQDLVENQELNIGGMITTVKTHITAKGSKMGFLTVDTLEGPVEVTIFSDLFESKSSLIAPDSIVMFAVRVNFRNPDQPSFVATDLHTLEETEEKLTRAIHVRLDEAGLRDAQLAEHIAETLGSAEGPCDVFLHCVTLESGEVVVHANNVCRVTPSRTLFERLEALVGVSNVWFSAGAGLPSHQPARIAQREEPAWKRAKARASAN